jgi:hypothetical protein
MKRIAATTLDELSANLTSPRCWRPYEYGGEWFAILHDGTAHLYRTRRAACAKAEKLGLTTILHAQ